MAVRTFSLIVLCAGLPLALPGGALAQHTERVGYVVAVVGDSVILNYDIDEDVYRLAAQGQQVPEQGDARRQLEAQLLQARIDQLVLLQAAQRDTSIQLEPDAIGAAVQQEVVRRERALGGPAQLEEALRRSGMSMVEFRASIEQQIRRDRMIEQYVQIQRRTRQPPPVTEDEMARYLEQNRARLGARPATLVFEQVVVPTTATDSAQSAARMKADSVYALALAGEDFEQLARRFSEDPGTRERGGDLGFFREGDMVTEFSRTAFSLRPGQISPPVLTSFGYHIIRLERIRSAERQARHILIRPQITEADAERARALADDIVAQLRAGANVDSLIRRHGDRDEQRRIGPLERDKLPEPYLSALATATEGEVLGPLPIGEAGAQKYAVVRIVDVEASGEYSLDDAIVRARIRQLLEQEKLFAEIVAELRRRTYIDVRQS